MSFRRMPIVESTLAALPRDPRLETQLADHATSAAPAWLWSADGSRILWANAVGAATFGAVNPSETASRRFDLKHPAAAEIARLAATLPPAGQVRLERLRGFGGSFGRALTSLCSRVALTDGTSAVLLVATEPAGPSLPLRERVSRLLGGREQMLAAFTADGTLLYATPASRARLGDASTLSALGITGIAAAALAAGSAGGTTPYGPVTIERLGRDATAVLVVQFDAPANEEAHDAASAAAKAQPIAAPPAEIVMAAAAATVPQAASGHVRDEGAAERRHPLRFVWQMDADGRFVVGSDEFIELMGPRTTAAFGRLWSEIAAELKLDPENQIPRAVATRETWSGVSVSWPVDDGDERLPVELSGLPVFDRDREFRGYRGFGVCRDLDRINHLARARRERPIGFMTPPEARAASEDASAATPPPEAPAETAAIAPAPAAPETKAEDGASGADRPALNVVPAAANVVPFRAGAAPEPKAPTLSPVERKAFRELAQELTARLHGVREDLAEANRAGVLPAGGEAHAAEPAEALDESEAAPPTTREHAGPYGDETQAGPRQPMPAFEPALLDRLPLGILIYRHDGAHDTLLHANRYFLELSGYESLDALAAAGGLDKLFAEPGADALAQTGSLQSLSIMSRDGIRRPVEGRLFTVPWAEGSALALILSNGEAAERRQSHALSLATAQSEIRELKAHVEAFKKTEAEMRAATREAQKAAAAKAEFVSKVSHEIRTPLNAITGFAELIIAERFGPIGNDRYRDYLKDIHAAGMHVVSLLNDLLDLSKIENGQLDLSFANVSLNDLTQQCVGIMQPQASRARIIIRTSLTPGLPQVVADERSLRQIVLNLLSNSIKFTGPGGQVIVSTAFADSGEAVLRVRDTGVGMSEKDVEAALEPFRQTATSGSWGSGGTGLGLPLTKALAEANRAHFSIKSAPNAGTLIEVAFPPTRVAR
jgi:signal transduction histidine kinase